MLRKYPLETISTFIGLVVLVIGLYLGQQVGWTGVLGNVLGIIGAFLSAVASAWSFGKASSHGSLTTQVEVLRGHLLTASAQIDRSIQRAVAGDEDSAVCFARIEQSTNVLTNVIRDLGRLTDGELRGENDAIVDAKQQIVDLGADLDRLLAQTSGDGSGDSNIQMIAEGLHEKWMNSIQALDLASPSSTLMSSTDERVECPSCGQPSIVRLRNMVGTTAHTTCPQCLYRYNVHRGAEKVFSRPSPHQRPTPTYLPCPNCSNDLPVTKFDGESVRFCLSCGWKLRIQMPARQVEVLAREDIVQGTLVGSTTIRCPKCNAEGQTFAGFGGKVFRTCSDCDVALYGTTANGSSPEAAANPGSTG